MSNWLSWLRKPTDFRDVGADTWFSAVAARLLNGTRLVVGGEALRLAEVEFYYFSAEHPDVFAHRDPIQMECGRWYFHRTGGVYRGGSFKGLDLTFGDGAARGGILIRGVDRQDDRRIDGPSLCVDHFLDATGAEGVAALDRAVAGRVGWDPGNPLRLVEGAEGEMRTVYHSARVGLSLKRARKNAAEPPRYLMRPYRYLTEPRRTAKGKAQLVLTLHAEGIAPEEIHKLTACPKNTVARYVADFEAGCGEGDLTPFYGKDLGPKDLCRRYGAWYAEYGPGQKRDD